MIKLSGKVVIKTIDGRHGPFNVGRLLTEIGEFSAKRGIEEFDPGTYAGEFAISRIYPANYIAGGRSIVEVRADIDAIALIDVDTRTVPSEPEPPIEAADAEPEAAGAPANEDDAALFSPAGLWPLPQAPFKLDPTVDRSLLRRQATRLKELGFQFNPVGRSWTQPEKAVA
ncbi:DUF3275 family protein [Ectothiorhodospira haloalkaliphila]|uniref:DUF3275 family protein n=1 Tax=Ectothiorhodospira haloalkaliphila TaxID=421628 RepID=UPI001EE7CE4F|nr:DUF3275 family protein [Ectothiorhodospira haloalkaliphila]MCG5526545.1 DUF3275 family protein [Ectothiorhodospira haloalkaliphila]